MKSWVAACGLLVLTLIWGATFPIVDEAMKVLPPLFFLTVRFVLAAAVILAIAMALGKARLNSVRAGLVCGAFLFLGFALQTVGIVYTTSARAAFVTGLCVVLVPAFEMLVFKVRLGRRVLAGVGLSFAGLFLLSLGGLLSGAPSDTRALLGDALVFLCAIAFAWHILSLARYGRTENAFALAGWQTLFVVPLAGVPSAVFERARWDWPTPMVWAGIVFLAVVATALVTVSQIHLQRFTTATQAALIFAMEPVFAAAFAWWFQGEVLPAPAIAGAGAMLVGCVLASLPTRETTAGT